MFNKNSNIIEETNKKSIDLLRELQTEKGFLASTVDVDNYRRIWGRDGVIIGLASLTTDEEDLILTFKKTLETLKKYQNRTGRIPSNVNLTGNKISYGTTVGRIDATIWYVIGVCRYFLKTNDQEFIKEFRPSLELALFYLESLELNGRGLIYIPGGGDWADEYINEGYVLFDQALYAIAIKYFGDIFGDEEKIKKYEHLLKLIEVNYFPSKDNLDNEYVYHKKIHERACEKYQPPLPLTSFSPFDVIYIHDLFALSLILNLPIRNEKSKKEMEKETEKNLGNDFPLLPAFNPVIDQNHARWNDLKRNYLYRFKNRPNEFHNGGLWPMVHGFYLASKTNMTKKELLEFAKILKKDKYIFPEFYHGKLYIPSGTLNLGFSAAGFLFAYDKYKNKCNPLEI